MVITWVPEPCAQPCQEHAPDPCPPSDALTVSLNGKRYEEKGFANFGNGHLYLQSHWGSGVVFTSANFTPDKN